MRSIDQHKVAPKHGDTEQKAQTIRENPFHLTPEDAELAARVIRTYMEVREERRTRKYRRRLLRSICLFSPSPTMERVDYEREAHEIWQQSWRDVGDYIRLAMLDYAAGKRT